MRHRKKKKVLDRKAGPRKALVSGTAANLILYERIRTTDARAKVVRSYAERLITRGKKNVIANQRYVNARLPVAAAARKIFEVLGPKYAERNGGYTRIVKVGKRAGDGANIVVLELV